MRERPDAAVRRPNGALAVRRVRPGAGGGFGASSGPLVSTGSSATTRWDCSSRFVAAVAVFTKRMRDCARPMMVEVVQVEELQPRTEAGFGAAEVVREWPLWGVGGHRLGENHRRPASASSRCTDILPRRAGVLVTCPVPRHPGEEQPHPARVGDPGEHEASPNEGGNPEQGRVDERPQPDSDEDE